MTRSNLPLLRRLESVAVADVRMSAITKLRTATQTFALVRSLHGRAARSLKLTFVTKNTGKFGRVNGLEVENWTKAGRGSR